MTDLIQRAMRFALEAHGDQRDKAGLPYAVHLADVASRLFLHGEKTAAVGWLHDVAEDTGTGLDEIGDTFKDRSMQAALKALTRGPAENYEAYLARVARNRMARLVKMADIASNSNPMRLSLLDVQTQHRLRMKYKLARSILAP